MIYFARWKILLVVAVCVLGVLYALPNMLSSGGRDWLQANLPVYFAPTQGVNLGLDLRGGSHLLLEVAVETVIGRAGAKSCGSNPY